LKTGNTYFTGSRRMKYILLTLIALVISDGLLSQFLIKHGLGYEGNPFLQSFVGEPNFLLIKVAGALLCALILWDIHKNRPKVALVSALLFVTIYTGIVFWNLGVFFFAQV